MFKPHPQSNYFLFLILLFISSSFLITNAKENDILKCDTEKRYWQSRIHYKDNIEFTCYFF
jgi:hypothetical protein